MSSSPIDILKEVRENIDSRISLLRSYSMIYTTTLDPDSYPPEIIKCSQSLEDVRELLAELTLLEHQVKSVKENTASASVEVEADDLFQYIRAVYSKYEIKEGTLKSHLLTLRGLMSHTNKGKTFGDRQFSNS